MDDIAAARLYRTALDIVRRHPERVLHGQMNINVGPLAYGDQQVLVRIPKADAVSPLDFRWREPDIVRAMERVGVRAPRLLFATSGWARREGHFQIHEFASNCLPVPPARIIRPGQDAVPVPQRMVEHDIPDYCARLLGITAFLPSPTWRVPRTAAEAAYARVTRDSQHWDRTAGRLRALRRDLGYAERFEDCVRPALRQLAEAADAPMTAMNPDVHRGNMLLDPRGRTVFLDPEYVDIHDLRFGVGFMAYELKLPDEQRHMLVDKTLRCTRVPHRGFVRGVEAWREYSRHRLVALLPELRSLALETLVRTGATKETAANHIVRMIPGNHHEIAWSLAQQGRPVPSPEAVAWAYYNEYERIVERVADEQRHGNSPGTLLRPAKAAPLEQPDEVLMAYATGRIRDNPDRHSTTRHIGGAANPRSALAGDPSGPRMDMLSSAGFGLSPMRAIPANRPLRDSPQPNRTGHFPPTTVEAPLKTWKELAPEIRRGSGNGI